MEKGGETDQSRGIVRRIRPSETVIFSTVIFQSCPSRFHRGKGFEGLVYNLVNVSRTERTVNIYSTFEYVQSGVIVGQTASCLETR